MPNHTNGNGKKNRVGRKTKDYRKKQRERLAKQGNRTPEDPKTGRPRNDNPRYR